MHTRPHTARPPQHRPAHTRALAAALGVLLGLLLKACALPTGPALPTPPAALPPVHLPPQALAFGPELAPTRVPCPAGPPADARCWRGQDSAAAPYLIVMPAQWSGTLFVHAHGGPALGKPTDARADEDIARWAIIVRQGHAYAASVFRQGGFAVTTAAQDTERVRRIFHEHIATPQRTVLHGQSWGAMVATRAAEMYPASWQGILLTSGVVAGASTYDFRIDLRAIYQHLCNNHPRPDEAAYPLHMGLGTGQSPRLKAADLNARINECLALHLPAQQRSPEQAAKVKLIANVVRIAPSSIASHLNWATFTLADLTQRYPGAPIGNVGVRYSGSGQDDALNAALDSKGLRFAAEPQARAQFLADVEHQGRFQVPVLSAHGIDDPTVFVESQDSLRQRMQGAGRSNLLVQSFVDSNQHSYWGDAMYPPLFNALLHWMHSGEKPSAHSIAAQCADMQTSRKAAPTDCKFVPNYRPQALSTRIPPR